MIIKKSLRFSVAVVIILTLFGFLHPGDGTKYNFNKVEFKTYQIKGEKYFKISDNFYVGTHYVKRIDTGNDYGLRVVVLKKNGNGYKIFFISKGAMDSYVLKPFFFKSKIKSDPLIILFESGAEYTWGYSVYIVEEGKTKIIRHLGYIDVAVIKRYGEDSEVDLDLDTESAIPYLQITGLNGKISFSFTKDVIYKPGAAKMKIIPKDRIKYVFDGTELKEIRD